MPLDIRTPSDPAFKTLVWGRVFNRRPRHQALHDSPPREPAAIALPRSRADVVDAVLEARARGWRIAVRSGGHSWAAWGVRAGTLLIDLRGLSVRPLTADPLQWGRESIEPLQSPDARPVAEDIAYDAASGVVSCGPAVSSGELNAALEAHGRFFAGGHHPDVGLGGFILQGGMGWNARGWGWACEQLVGVDVVTADGKVVEAREGDEEGDRWLWLARGAGPGFPGVVTRLHLRTRRKTELWQSMYFLELEKTEDVLERVIKVSRIWGGTPCLQTGPHLQPSMLERWMTSSSSRSSQPPPPRTLKSSASG
jgi:FAD/FMN-containing dehydrogenase